MRKSKYKHTVTLFIIFILNLWCPGAFAYKLYIIGDYAMKWKEESVTYYINPSGGPSGSLSAIKAAMKTWSNVSTSSFEFIYGGTTESKVYGEGDGSNIVCFGPISTGIAGENRTWYDLDRLSITDSDIKLDTKHHKWSTNGSGDSNDVQSVVTHELGHSLKLSDLYGKADTEKTMYGHGAGKIGQRTLHQDDIDGITYLYPSDYIPHTGAISVYVYYTNGEPTSSELKLKGKKKKTSIITEANGDGFFKFLYLRADTYTITAGYKSDKSIVKQKVTLEEGEEKEIIMILKH